MDRPKGVTFTRVGAFASVVAAVLYLLLAKHLFGLRGGRKAYDSERRGEQLLEVERSALGSDPPPPQRRPHNGRQHRRTGAGNDRNRPAPTWTTQRTS